jgi:hypothetical protein
MIHTLIWSLNITRLTMDATINSLATTNQFRQRKAYFCELI